MKKLHRFKIGTLGLAAMLVVGAAQAAVSPADAEKLKNELTPFGAERAGNADGTIPAWEGGLTGVPEGIDYKPGDFLQDPFADDKVLYSITAANLDQYKDKLNPGQVEMFKKYPDTYRIDVYPTRRTAAAPEWVYENTFKNATRTKLTEDGLGMEGGYGGTPFPIPQNAEEVVYNHIGRWKGEASWATVTAGLVLDDGTFSVAGGGLTYEKFPYHLKGGKPGDNDGDVWWIYQSMVTPKRRKGELLVVRDNMNPTKNERKAWQYLPGQRRVRRAPTIAYDTPNPSGAGLNTYDDANLFNGALDRYDWKLLGKQEVYIPYNSYKAELATIKEYLTPYHRNPDVMRWELHRVWVVEATLKEGKRHTYSKRTLYIDEDSWLCVLTDRYDGKGNLWRTGVQNGVNYYNLPGYREASRADYDFQSSSYAVNAIFNEQSKFVFFGDVDDSMFTPETLRRKGRR